MASTTTGLSNLMSTFYDKVFLDRAEAELQYDFGAQVRKVPMNSGKTVIFNRFSTLAAATTALTEATNPSGSDMTTTQVSATVAEYGDFVKVGSLFEMTSIDDGLKEHAEVMGYQAGLTVDTLIKNELSANATVQFATAKTALSALSATDVLSSAEIKKAVRTLRKNKAKTFANGLYRGIVPTSAVYDLRGDATWLSAQIYTDASKVKNGAVGALHGVDFIETNNESSESSTVTVYHTFIFGMNAYGSINLQGQPDKKILVKKPGANDTSNPLDMFSTIGWKLTFVAKVLNAGWIIVIKSGVTA
jgi:N4-gp56 family major capsid protein